MKLTEAAISKIPPQGKADVVFFDNDLPGFGLRIRAGGSRSWVFQYKLGPKHRRITLGKYPALPSGKARETAVKLYAEVRLGKDPQGTKADSRARAAETVGAVLKIYLAGRRGELRASSYREFERHLLRNLAPIHGLHVTAVNLRTVAAQLTRITRECGPAQANRTRESLSAFLNWCA